MAIYMWRELPNYLCFTANTAGSTVALQRNWSPTAVTLETSTDWVNWTTYTINTTIVLSNIWDKLYWRNTSTTDTSFGLSNSAYYQFVMNWSIAASWDIWYLLNKNSTTTMYSYCFFGLFLGCTSLKMPPKLPATTLANNCYDEMFANCTNLEWLPALPSLALVEKCYYYMFYGCSKIKISYNQTWDYQTPYRIPTTWTATETWASTTYYMFTNTWWPYATTPSKNTTYYTSNTVV